MLTLGARVTIRGAAGAGLVGAIVLAGGVAAAQTSLVEGTIRAVSALEYRYPAVDQADSSPEFVDVFPSALVLNTSSAGPVIITFSAHCDMRGGTGVHGGIMLVHVTVDGHQPPPGEVEMLRAGPGESRGSVCSYSWMVPNVPSGRHEVQARLRIFAGYGGGFARVVTSTMTVFHDR